MTRTIIITGAGSGIGRVTAQTFLDKGWRVGLIGRREDALRETAAGSDALVLPCDVCDAGAVDAAFDRAAAEWGRLDVLFNNAGTGLVPQTPDLVEPDEFRRVIDVNVNGVFICARAAFRVMRAQSPQGGRIINNGSVSAHAPRPGSIGYTTSKHAVTGITRSISLDGRPFNIACGQIDIGNALTDMAVAMTKGVPQADGSMKVEPVMDAQAVADTVMHMASLPDGANVQFVTVMATNMPFIGRG
ncbi:SDR family oxidoreductase [Paracoccus contaminans]|uniref:3-oxoacyl-ACP reductase n=1 Tax=Paracoccus contaminans TaxID=1945662 RepID=A0A1W6CTW1_9RHOB|nr:SDR family oxidoreductase [Paracoccus contaminans]ARJ68313.1 3-oxoacyl-ACP reductase [Paracoccus contaminans]